MNGAISKRKDFKKIIYVINALAVILITGALRWHALSTLEE